MNSGYFKVAAAIPDMTVGGIYYNTQSIKSLIVELNAQNAELAVFPEMCLYGAVNPPISSINSVASECEKAIIDIAEFTKNRDVLCLIGMPLRVEDKIVNCAALVGKGKILAIFYKPEIKFGFLEISLNNFVIPFTNKALLRGDTKLPVNIAVNIGTIRPYDNINANIVLNLYGADLGNKNFYADYFETISLIPPRAIISVCGTINNNFLPYKSACICECGEILTAKENAQIITAELDIEKIINRRILSNTSIINGDNYIDIPVNDDLNYNLTRIYQRLPYISKVNLKVIYNSLVDAMYSIIKIKNQKMAFGHCKNFWLLVSLANDMSKKYNYPPDNIAIIMLEGVFDETQKEFISQLGFNINNVPYKHISDNIKNAVIADWIDLNNAFLLNGIDRTDLIQNRKINSFSGGVNILSNFNKTVLNACLHFRRAYDNNWAKIMTALIDEPQDIFNDFFIYHYVDNGLSEERVLNIAVDTFKDFGKNTIYKNLTELIKNI